MSERISTSRVIPATPSAVFEVLTDPEGHVAIDSSGMLQSAEGQRPSAVGDSFIVHMDRESLGDVPMGRYDVEVVITRIDEDALVEWTIHGTIKPPIGHVYGYELVADPSGTRVTSYCDWSDAAEKWKHVFPVIDEKSLRASLGILERAVLRGYPRPGRLSQLTRIGGSPPRTPPGAAAGRPRRPIATTPRPRGECSPAGQHRSGARRAAPAPATTGVSGFVRPPPRGSAAGDRCSCTPP